MKGRGELIRMLALGLTLCAGLLGGLSMAQETVPQEALGTGFTYQGSLADASGPVTGTCRFSFILYDEAGSGEPPVGGTSLGTETVDGVEVREGLFAVYLDFGTGAFTGEARWLEIAVDCGGGDVTLSPRQALTPAPYALALPGLWTQQNPYSPNLIGGYGGSEIASGVYGATIGGGGKEGIPNRVAHDFGTVGGGYGNESNSDATVGGGAGNEAWGYAATVGGGYQNTASGHEATVSGGTENTASGELATIGGGDRSSVTGQGATVAGGSQMTITGDYATIGGGQENSASFDHATVGGGARNSASGYYATVGGGADNTASWSATTVSGGYHNTASRGDATVGGGENNAASAYAATAGGGSHNTVRRPSLPLLAFGLRLGTTPSPCDDSAHGEPRGSAARLFSQPGKGRKGRGGVLRDDRAWRNDALARHARGGRNAAKSARPHGRARFTSRSVGATDP